MKKLLIIIMFAVTIQNNYGQSVTELKKYPYWIEWMQNDTVNFNEVKRAFYLYYSDYKTREKEMVNEVLRGKKESEEDENYVLFKRWEYMMERRVDAFGNRPKADHLWTEYFKEQKKNKFETQSLTPPTWKELGPLNLPTNNGGQPNGEGRIAAIAFSPKKAGTIYVGAPAGGLWISTDTGRTWKSNTDNLPSLGVSSIAIDPVNDSIIYIGTGDRDAGDAAGLGVMKSVNKGVSWTLINGGMGNVTVNEILIDPSDRKTLVAGTSAGIYKTTNSGTTWSSKKSGLNFKDIEYHPKNPKIMYATESSKFYRSTDGGDSWVQITSGLTTASRGCIAVTNADTSYVYFLVANSSSFSGFYLSKDGGRNFTKQSSTPNIMDYSSTGSGSGGQGWYDLCTVADTANKKIVYCGGVNVFKSSDEGKTWTCVAHWVGSGAPAVHADQHVLVINKLDNKLYAGNDGGVYYTSNGGTKWTNIGSGLNIGQMYKIGQSDKKRDLVMAGLQDNGSECYNGAWATVFGGDGMEAACDPKDTNYRYCELYYGTIARARNSVSYGYVAGNGYNGINEQGAWVTPYILSPTNGHKMFIGYKNIWRTSNAHAASPTFTKISSGLGGTNSYNFECLDLCETDSNVLYAARQDYKLFRTDNANSATPTWTDLTSTLPYSANVIRDIKTDPIKKNVVYMTQGGDVFRSNNKGATWKKITGTLPSTYKSSLACDKNSPGGIYIGTDLGVYYKDTTMSDWMAYKTGLPANLRIAEVEIYSDPTTPTNSRIRAATYGRGVWENSLYSSLSAATADFSFTNVCLGTTTIFTDKSSTDASDKIVKWDWNFGDTKTSTSQSPTHIYTKAGSFIVWLKITTQKGYFDSTSKTVNVYPVPVAKFGFTNACLGQSVTFTDSSTISSGSISSRKWDFGDGKSSVLINPTHTYSGAGTFTVKLTTTSNSGCTDSIKKTVTIYTPPTSSFTSSDACQGISILFTDKSTASNGDKITTWGWDFGDGKTSTSKNPTHTYNKYGKFTVTLIAGTDKGCSDTSTATINIYEKPVATFNAAPQCEGSTTLFADLSTLTGKDTIKKWSWDFGDLSSSNSQSPMHKYASAGTYSVQLIVSTNNGCGDTIIKNVSVYPMQKTNFGFNNSCQGTSVKFTDSTKLSGGSIVTYQWYFGDKGTSGLQNPSHTYYKPGTYPVTLKTYTDKGCIDSIVKVLTIFAQPASAFSTSNVCDGSNVIFKDVSTASKGDSIITWFWNFGDGKTSSQQNPTHLYNTFGKYNITLISGSNHGCTDTSTKQIEVYPVPSASFTGANVCSGEIVSFQDKSTLATGNITKYFWNFGDGQISTSTNPVHTYTSSGKFLVSLKITSDKGCSDSTSDTVIIYGHPNANFFAADVCNGTTVIFNDSSLNPTFGGYIKSWKWDFGDGSGALVQNPKHSYTLSGSYDVKLITTSNWGCGDTISKTVNVYDNPKAYFKANNVCLGESMAFSDSSTIAKGGIISQVWYFGDGDSSTAKTPTHSYSTSGTKKVSLIVVSNHECTNTFIKNVEVYGKPSVRFSSSSGCQIKGVSFVDSSSISNGTISQYFWNFGDSTSSSQQNPPIHIYAKPGSYTVTLKVSSTSGCLDSTSQSISVYENPVSSFTSSGICIGDSTHFTNNSTPSVSTYFWDFGDGKTSMQKSPAHLYAATGKYKVSLVNTYADCSDTSYSFIEIHPKPDAGFKMSKSNLVVHFTPNDTLLTSFEWDFGDGTKSTSVSPDHRFSAIGLKTVSLIVTDSFGCSSTSSDTVTVSSSFEEQKIKLGNIMVYPNPYHEYFITQIEVSTNSRVDLCLRDLTGKVIWRHNYELTKGISELKSETNDLSDGFYILDISLDGIHKYVEISKQ